MFAPLSESFRTSSNLHILEMTFGGHGGDRVGWKGSGQMGDKLRIFLPNTAGDEDSIDR